MTYLRYDSVRIVNSTDAAGGVTFSSCGRAGRLPVCASTVQSSKASDIRPRRRSAGVYGPRAYRRRTEFQGSLHALLTIILSAKLDVARLDDPVRKSDYELKPQ